LVADLSAPPALTVVRWTAPDRLDDILDMVRSAFAGLEPPSGVLNETVADLAARQRAGIVLVAQTGTAFVGSLFCEHKGDALYLTRMASAPAWRKSGIGRALLEAAKDEARRLGLKRLTLRVRVTLPGNLAYFKRAGFVVTGEGQEAGRTPYITMERALEPAGAG
jgi:predicted N-acetyltransferase YhbS